MNAANEKLIRDFCTAWERGDLDELAAYFSDDAIYHNMPLEPVKGRSAIRATFETFVSPAEKVEFEMLHLASSDGLVFTERLDRFVIKGKKIELPVAGVFEVRDGKIVAWRDYFDLQTWLRQNG